MFCGDETGGFVGEVGYSNSRFGWSGEDCPKLTVPTLLSPVGRIGISALHAPPQLAQPRSKSSQNTSRGAEPSPSKLHANPSEPSTIKNWDAYESLWSQAFDTLKVDQGVHPVITMLSSHAPDDHKLKIMEIMYEKFSTNALFIAESAALSAFSQGRHTALIVDCSGGSNTVTPIVDGIALKKSMRYNVNGGEYISGVMAKGIEVKYGKIQTKWEEGGMRDYCLSSLMTDLKSSHLSILPSSSLDPKEITSLIPKDAIYELPDGTKVKLGDAQDVFCATECLFSDAYGSSGGKKGVKRNNDGDNDDDVKDEITPAGDSERSEPTNANYLNKPLPYLINNAVSAVDVDLRSTLLSAILLCGNSSAFPNFDSRLQTTLMKQSQQYSKSKIISGVKVERNNAAWIGGSILSSLGSFQQLWCSKKEYEEYGVVLASQRFF